MLYKHEFDISKLTVTGKVINVLTVSGSHKLGYEGLQLLYCSQHIIHTDAFCIQLDWNKIPPDSL